MIIPRILLAVVAVLCMNLFFHSIKTKAPFLIVILAGVAAVCSTVLAIVNILGVR